MARLETRFVAADLPEDDLPKRDFEPMPKGDYHARITSSEIKPTANGMGQLLALRWDITGGPFDGRVVFQQENIVHSSPQAQAIGQRQLGQIAFACGKQEGFDDTEELHHIDCVVHLDIEAREGFSPRNVVKRVKPSRGPAPAKSAAPARQQSSVGAGSFVKPNKTETAGQQSSQEQAPRTGGGFGTAFQQRPGGGASDEGETKGWTRN